MGQQPLDGGAPGRWLAGEKRAQERVSRLQALGRGALEADGGEVVGLGSEGPQAQGEECIGLERGEGPGQGALQGGGGPPEQGVALRQADLREGLSDEQGGATKGDPSGWRRWRCGAGRFDVGCQHTDLRGGGGGQAATEERPQQKGQFCSDRHS